MSMADDVADNFIRTYGWAELNEDSKKLLADAVKYGFNKGESFGKYEQYAEKVETKYLIQPENDRLWQEELEAIQKDTDTHDLIKQTKLLGLIAEMILYRRRGD